MEKYICNNVFIPLRSAPSHRSEMLSQLLFGEKYIITEKSGTWQKIKTVNDNYPGWIDMDHINHIIDGENLTAYILNRSLVCYKPDKSKMVLEAGCQIYNPDFDNNQFSIGNKVYKTNSDFNNKFVEVNESLADTAMRFINSPYIWGGRIPSGIDCSGFTQLVYKIHSISIPRDSYIQAEEGKSIDFIDDSIPGDLVFFDNARGNISHVGMILSKGLIIHASGIVRIDSIDHQGIFKQEIKNYSHHLRTIKRIV